MAMLKKQQIRMATQYIHSIIEFMRKRQKELFAALREKDIYVRYFDKPRINNYLRVTIGTDEQMEALFAFLKEYMNR